MVTGDRHMWTRYTIFERAGMTDKHREILLEQCSVLICTWVSLFRVLTECFVRGVLGKTGRISDTQYPLPCKHTYTNTPILHLRITPKMPTFRSVWGMYKASGVSLPTYSPPSGAAKRLPPRHLPPSNKPPYQNGNGRSGPAHIFSGEARAAGGVRNGSSGSGAHAWSTAGGGGGKAQAATAGGDGATGYREDSFVHKPTGWGYTLDWVRATTAAESPSLRGDFFFFLALKCEVKDLPCSCLVLLGGHAFFVEASWPRKP